MPWNSWWDNVAQRQNTAELAGGLRRVQAAQNAPYGSIAQRDDPNNYGSVLSRQHPGVFGSQGMANPSFVAAQKQQAAQQRYQQLLQRQQALRTQQGLRYPQSQGGGDYTSMLVDLSGDDDGF